MQAQLFGISRQALHKRKKAAQKNNAHKQQICSMVKVVRQFIPRAGTRTLLDIMSYSLKMRGVSIGRDRLFEILRELQLLVPRRKRHFYTTDSKHRFRKYPNIAKDLVLTKPEQLWVSDITYIRSKQGPMYLSIITDAYSRKIMGYHLADHLKATGPIEALKMALKNRKYPKHQLMHHSDKGVQYCCDEYIKILNDNNILISMTSKYDPYENAKAERVNETIKCEFLLDEILPDNNFAKREIRKTIEIYNNLRPHQSCYMNTPEQMHLSPNPFPIKLKTNQLWENIFLNNFNLN